MEGAKRAVSRLDLPKNVKEFLTTSWGISTLHPPQFEAMSSVLGGDNTLLAIPTASGKSLVAYIGIMKRILVDEPTKPARGKKGVERAARWERPPGAPARRRGSGKGRTVRERDRQTRDHLELPSEPPLAGWAGWLAGMIHHYDVI